jgi:hypothetical protein
MFHIFIAGHFPDLQATPVQYAIAAAHCDDMMKETAFNKKVNLFDINNDPKTLLYWSIVSACALIKRYEEKNPEAADKQQYTIMVPNREVYQDAQSVFLDDINEGTPFSRERQEVRGAILDVAPGRICFELLDDLSEYGYLNVKMKADLIFLEKVSKDLCFPNSSLIMPTQDLTKPFYCFDLGTGHRIETSKPDPHDEAKITTGFYLPTPSYLDFTMHRTIRVKDRRIPRDTDKDSRKRADRQAWKTHKKETKTEFFKKLRSE